MPTHQERAAPVRQPEGTPQSARIKVVGVGGGGSNAIDRMIDFGVEGVEFIALNTDIQALEVSKAPVRGQLGSLLTNGLSAGSDPNVGRRAAIQDAADIAEVLEGADMVFVTAGLGGGTGTGAAPVIAAIASEMGALTVAIVTRPFNFEGKRRMAIADWGIDHLLRYVDTLIVIPNEKLLAIANDAPFFESFRIADDFLRQAVQSITDIITTEGVINRDFADVKTIMAGMGYAVMGTASRSGPTRAIDAVMDAMASPLLEEGAIDGARGILINITGSSSLRLSEVNAASRVIQGVAHEDANIIFGAVLDERLGDEVKATVIATGFRMDGRDRSDRRARLLRAAGPDDRDPEPLRLEPVAAKPEAVVETSTIEPAVVEPFLTESTPTQQPQAIEIAPAETVAIEPEPIEPEPIDPEPIEPAAIEPERSQPEDIEISTVEEVSMEVSESSLEAPEVEAIEVNQPEPIQEPLEETSQPGDQQFAIEVYESQDLLVEDPPRRHPVELGDVDHPELDASEESQAEPLDEEEDWRSAIREIARLAEPEFGVENESNGDAAGTTHWNRFADPSPRSEATGLERSPLTNNFDVEEQNVLAPQAANRSAPAKLHMPAATTSVAEPAHITTTRRAAMAAYAAVSPGETEPETEAEIGHGQYQTKPVNAFAQVLEARRRFVETLGKLPSEQLVTPQPNDPAETYEPTSPRAPQGEEEDSRFHQAGLAPEPLEHRQAQPSRPRTIDAQNTAANTLTSQGVDELEVDDLPKPPPVLNRRLLREGTVERNGELFESHWNSEIRVPSFGSISEE